MSENMTELERKWAEVEAAADKIDVAKARNWGNLDALEAEFHRLYAEYDALCSKEPWRLALSEAA